jgi:hypothetical protein
MKRLLFLLLFLVSVLQGFSQTVGISYQGVILNPDPQELPGLDAQGNILANSAVSIQFIVVNESGIQEYQEQHNTSTDRYGMINLLIGSGSATGGTDFTDILWNGTTKKLKVGIDFSAGSNFMALSEQNLTYMPQPPTAEVIFELAEITKVITDEVTRAGLAEVANAESITDEVTRAELAELANATGISTIETDQTTQNTAIGLNTVKEGISSAQASSITANTAKISFDSISSTRLSSTEGTNTGDQNISGIAINATGISVIETDQTTQNTAIGLNTVKEGISSAQASSITANTDKVGITAQQSDAITTNTDKVGYTEVLVSANTDVAANTSKVGVSSYAVGDFAHGGIVFWIDETGQHGLVCAKVDSSAGVRWYAGTYGTTQAKGDGPYAGKANTVIIIAAQVSIGDDGAIYAARICNELQVTEEGKTYGDWFLPSKYTLNQMYQNRVTINSTATANGGSAFGSNWFWSSTEGDYTVAWTQYFDDGRQAINYKLNITDHVRAVRAF